MSVPTGIDDLIEAAWNVVAGEFDECALHEWRKLALNCVVELCGRDHDSANHFRRRLRDSEFAELSHDSSALCENPPATCTIPRPQAAYGSASTHMGARLAP